MRKFLWIALGGAGLLVGYSLIRRQLAHAADPGLAGLNLPAEYLADTTPQTSTGNRLLTLMDDGDMRALVRRGINADDCRPIGRNQWRCDQLHSNGGTLTFTPAAKRKEMRKRRENWWLNYLGDYATARSRRTLCAFADVVPNIAMRMQCGQLTKGATLQEGYVPMTEIVGFVPGG